MEAFTCGSCHRVTYTGDFPNGKAQRGVCMFCGHTEGRTERLGSTNANDVLDLLERHGRRP